MRSALRLAFVTTYDASSIHAWSGIPYFMARALVREGISVSFVGSLKKKIGVRVLARGYAQRLRRRGYMFDRDPDVQEAYARQIESRLQTLAVDAVLSPSTIPIAYLETGLPVVSWTDATFAAMVDYYSVDEHSAFSGLSESGIRVGNATERAAIERASACVYSSVWAAQSALNAYGADPEKVHVLPFGANLRSEPDRRHVAALIEERSRQGCKLLFIGTDWFRKGGDLALATASRLVELGLPTRLTVVGCRREDVPDSELIDCVGYIDKSTPSGEASIVQLLSESHFLCLPARAECFGVVFCEASAYGVPSVSTRTGGVESAVKHKANGYVFDESTFIDSAAATIAECMAKYDELYIPLAQTSHEEYRSRLNWKTSTRRLMQLASRLVSRA